MEIDIDETRREELLKELKEIRKGLAELKKGAAEFRNDADKRRIRRLEKKNEKILAEFQKIAETADIDPITFGEVFGKNYTDEQSVQGQPRKGYSPEIVKKFTTTYKIPTKNEEPKKPEPREETMVEKDEDKGQFAEAAKQARINEKNAAITTKAVNESTKGFLDALNSLDVKEIKAAINNVIETRAAHKLSKMSVKEIINTRNSTNTNAKGLYPIEVVVGNAGEDKSIAATKYLIDEGAIVAGRTVTYTPELKTDIAQAVYNDGIGVSRKVLGNNKAEFTIDLASYPRTQKNFGLSELLRSYEKQQLGITGRTAA